MGRATHNPVRHAERIHDIERCQRHVRGLEDVAAGIEDKVRTLTGLRSRAILQPSIHILAEPLQFPCVELHPREDIDPVGNQPEIIDSLLTPTAQFRRLFRKRDARHRQ